MTNAHPFRKWTAQEKVELYEGRIAEWTAEAQKQEEVAIRLAMADCMSEARKARAREIKIVNYVETLKPKLAYWKRRVAKEAAKEAGLCDPQPSSASVAGPGD